LAPPTRRLRDALRQVELTVTAPNLAATDAMTERRLEARQAELARHAIPPPVRLGAGARTAGTVPTPSAANLVSRAFGLAFASRLTGGLRSADADFPSEATRTFRGARLRSTIREALVDRLDLDALRRGTSNSSSSVVVVTLERRAR
jgi:hypothetical protein